MTARLGLALLLILAIRCDGGGTSGMNEPEDSDEEETVPEPSISSVSPSEGGIGTELSIEGTDFQSDATVKIDDSTATDVEVTSASQIYANVPAGIQSKTPVSVSVHNSSDKTAVRDSAYTAIEPELSFVNSATLSSGQVGSTAILDGRAFGDLQGSGTVLFSAESGGSVSASVETSDDWTETFIVTTVPSGAGDGPVRVKTELGVSDSIANIAPS